MGNTYRAPSNSPTPSVGSGAPTPEILPDNPLVARILSRVRSGATSPNQEIWTLFVGNLHPRVTRSELYEVFKTRGCHKIRNIILRCASGAGVTVIPEKDMTDQDRCYASVEIKGFEGAWAALKGWWKSTNPPELHGLPVYIGLTASEMPEAAAILKNITRSLLRNVHQAENRSTKKREPKPKRIAMQKTEWDGESPQRSQAGPSRHAKRKPRFTP